MSWQRILELAREQGMPVIVTDLAGRDSMVVMPLERFEQLTHHSKMNAACRKAQVPIFTFLKMRSKVATADKMAKRLVLGFCSEGKFSVRV